MYLGKPAPPEAERLLKRASEAIDALTLGRIDPNNPEHLEAAQKATCAQVERMLELGENMEVTGRPKSFSIGNFSMDFGSGGGFSELAPRARQYLFLAGLLYRGVGMR